MASSTRVVTTASAAETQALGVELAGELGRGDVVAFHGDLGSGKTCLIQGICRGLGVADYVTSPTFILINEYRGRVKGEQLPVYHFDLYRLHGPGELEDLGADEYLYGQGICLIEWADRAPEALPGRRREIAIGYLGADTRRITIRALEA